MSRGGGRRRGSPGAIRVAGITFGNDELRDLAAAWLALSVAFAILFAGGGMRMFGMLASDLPGAVQLFVLSLLTAGLGFLLHELAHKVVAVRFGQSAAFRANYQMLGLAVVVSLAGFIFAAPGAVYHRGRITEREQGLVALAGPAVNVVLGLAFAVPLVVGVASMSNPVFQLGRLGVGINFLLAGFNMIPFGPLDGATVKRWSSSVYLLTAVPCILLGVVGFMLI